MTATKQSNTDARAEFVPPGIWLKITATRPAKRQGAIFLDRDGVIVEDSGYLSKSADIRLVPGAADLVGAINAANLLAVVVTNQSGIARGYFGWETFSDIQLKIEHKLKSANAILSAVVACPFHPDFSEDYAESLDGWRKPGPKMLQLVAERLNVDLGRSVLIGDNITDISAANAAGLMGSILVLSGHGRTHAQTALGLNEPGFEVIVSENPIHAIEPLRRLGFPV